MRILVGYGSRYGSTREVAEAITRKLQAAGDDARCMDASIVDAQDIGEFDAVIIGSGLYAGRMRLRARRLLRDATRAAVPVAVFGLGPLANDAEQWASARSQLNHEVARVRDASPVVTSVFGGRLEPAEMHFPFSRMPRADLRDWEAIEAWALEARSQLASRMPAATRAGT